MFKKQKINSVVKGYKAFDKGLKCRGFKYEVGKEYIEKEEIKLCEKGIHFCENPLDVLDYYNLCDSEFAEVEATGKTITDGQKTVTDRIKISCKLDLSAFIKASFNFLWEKCNFSGKDEKVQAASGDYSQLAASGYYSQLAASGDYSQLAASGDSSKLAASGDSSKLAASGYYSQLAASGDSSKLAASGYSSQLAASGDSSKLAASGYYSQLAASGDYSQLAASGDSSKLAASGDSSKLAASGDYSIAAGIGYQNIAKGKKGNWIVLAEWIYDKKVGKYIPVCVKTARIDGKKIKEDTYYILKNKKFVEQK